MKYCKTIFIFSVIFIFPSLTFGQINPNKTQTLTNSIKSSPAYAEILLRKVELESEVESLLISYTENFPKVKEGKFELSVLQKDLDKLLSQTDASKLTLALGKLMVRKNQLETDYWVLQNRLSEEHTEVKRAKRKVINYQNAIKEILP